MSNAKRTAKKLAAALVLVSVLLITLCSCIITGDFVASHLEDLGVPKFKHSKLKSVEVLYRDYYVKDVPPASELAPKVAEVYFEKYHDKIDTGDTTAVTDALVLSYISLIGDRYSYYRTEEEHKEYDASMSGSYFGIGIVVTYDAELEKITVTEVYEGSGAHEAGIKPGDEIIAANEKKLADVGYDAILNEIRGEANTTVDVTVKRGEDEYTFTVTRKKIVEKTVSYSINDDKIGYIKISSFKSNTPKQFKEALKYMTANDAVAIIYDLRGNGGGYLDALVDVVSCISPIGTTIATFSDGEIPEKDRTIEHLYLPTVVLCNENTASAAELFTACMRDFEQMGFFDVTLVGEKTYGKGVMQRTFSFTDGSSLTLTIAYYSPPLGENYDGDGIKPDRTVQMTEEGDAQLDAAYTEINKLINK